MKKILWISRNQPLNSQIGELKRLFGEDVIIDQDVNPFASASDIVKRYKKGFYDEMVLIAPLSVCRVITEYGYRPLWSEMRQVSHDDPNFEVEVEGSQGRVEGKKRRYQFIRFKRLIGIDVNFEPVESFALDK